MTQHGAHRGTRGLIGQPLRRFEDRRLVAGAGAFVDDLHLPGELTLAILRSPYPHARIGQVRLDRARHAPGVVDALDGRETAHLTHLAVNTQGLQVRRPDHPPLAVGAARYVGDEVAAVLAQGRYQARDALDLIEVDYHPLPGVAHVEPALADGAPLVHPQLGTNVAVAHAFGSAPEAVEAALARADHVVTLRIENGRLAPVALEPRAVLASHDAASGQLTVWTSTQRPFGIRDELAAALGLPPDRVRVVAPDVGGGFGSKGMLYREELLAAYLALKHGRPVRWSATRSEEFQTSIQSREQVDLVEAGFTRQGELIALRVRILANLGAYLVLNSLVPPMRTARLATGAYRVPVARSEVVAAFTNTAPTGPYRGAGRPEAAFLIERVMDVAARDLGLDPVDLRRRNFIRPDEFPWPTPTGLTYDSGDYERTLDHALELADYPALRARRERARAEGRLFGIGLATFIEPSGGGWESGRVRVEPDGRVIAATGSSPHGQGLTTSFAQVVAERLQVPVERVTVLHGDTAAVPPGVGTFGSRSLALGGSALARAADAVLDRMRRIAAHLLEVEPSDVIYDDGAFHPAGVADRRVDFAAVAAAAYRPAELPPGLEPGLEASERFEAAHEAFSNGAYVVAVEVERDTGRPRLDTLVAVDDSGVVVNPLLAEGQVHGGLAQGIGQALLERVVYDADGTLYTGTLMDYGLARAADLPTFVVGETQTPSPLNPLGAKGVGEAGAVGAPPAIVNAVVDALAPFGVRHLDMPLTAERLWRTIHEGSGATVAEGGGRDG